MVALDQVPNLKFKQKFERMWSNFGRTFLGDRAGAIGGSPATIRAQTKRNVMNIPLARNV